ncbi:hypothetical protein K402DRAFT_399337 [Aulographum hederae CBS 113979]|uniref:Uncharacterized protein n=1 Tax=Aulographum hederae CBS 113979 TaxID=1176131 RepID=A0A6G1HGN9_9PEZI|nr:hypothetical protein K402DRAFT_399337 [Aulographum hederae CBS 113979]
MCQINPPDLSASPSPNLSSFLRRVPFEQLCDKGYINLDAAFSNELVKEPIHPILRSAQWPGFHQHDYNVLFTALTVTTKFLTSPALMPWWHAILFPPRRPIRSKKLTTVKGRDCNRFDLAPGGITTLQAKRARQYLLNMRHTATWHFAQLDNSYDTTDVVPDRLPNADVQPFDPMYPRRRSFVKLDMAYLLGLRRHYNAYRMQLSGVPVGYDAQAAFLHWPDLVDDKVVMRATSRRRQMIQWAVGMEWISSLWTADLWKRVENGKEGIRALKAERKLGFRVGVNHWGKVSNGPVKCVSESEDSDDDSNDKAVSGKQGDKSASPTEPKRRKVLKKVKLGSVLGELMDGGWKSGRTFGLLLDKGAAGMRAIRPTMKMNWYQMPWASSGSLRGGRSTDYGSRELHHVM